MENEKENLINKKELNFPEGFLWGTSMSAYQVEGGNVNDWSVWEKSAPRLKELMKKKKFSEDFICADACDFWNRYESDFDLAKSLNNNAVRIGLEWSRIEPEKNKINVSAINHYKKMLRTAREKKLITVVTLWHFSLPIWFAAEGGWTNKKAVDYFLRYASLVIKELGGDIDIWVTLNEPTIHMTHGYLTGKFPPNKKRKLFKFFKVAKNLARAHRKTYGMIHDHFPKAIVGISMMVNYVEPARRWCLPEIIIAKIFHYYSNSMFLNKIKHHIDYMGIDYYHHDRIVWYPPFRKNKNRQLTDIGWEIYPKGIYHALKFLAAYKKPVYILENGLADEDDSRRPEFLKKHLKYVHKAMEDGVNVKGYFHWSLLDNFEWADGYGPKFGLYEVNRTTMERTARGSAAVYSEICKQNSVGV